MPSIVVASRRNGNDAGAAEPPHNPLYATIVALVAAAAGLLFGYDIAVINGAILLLKRQFALTEFQTEWAASSLLAGCVAGAVVGGWLSDRWGRKKVLIGCAVLFGLSSVGAALPNSLAQFAWARLAGGVAIGVSSMLAPLYIAEVAPARSRGKLVALQQMTIVSGILLAYFVNWALSFGGENSWRGMFLAAVIPSALFLVGLLFVPESPRWLASKGRDAEALAVLDRVQGPAAAALEMAAIREALKEEEGSFAELLQPGLRRAVGLAVAMAILQQWTGINTVLFYGSVLLKDYVGGSTDSSAIGANVLIGIVNVISTIIALALIDKLGRKPLLMGSAAGLGLGLAGLALAFLQQPPQGWLVVTLMLWCAGWFAVGLGPGVWVLLAEIFPNRVRGRAMSVGTVALWAACTVLTFTFLSIASTVGASGAFALYSVLNVLTIWVVARFAPETKGRTLEEIETLWRHK